MVQWLDGLVLICEKVISGGCIMLKNVMNEMSYL